MLQTKREHVVILLLTTFMSIFLILEHDIEFKFQIKRHGERLEEHEPMKIKTEESLQNEQIAPSQSPSETLNHSSTNLTTLDGVSQPSETPSLSPNMHSSESPSAMSNSPTLHQMKPPNNTHTFNDNITMHQPSYPLRNNRVYSILPKRIYSIIGLESSGTQFVSRMIRDALHLQAYREGSFPYGHVSNEAKEVQVQHFSLPWGSTCQQDPHVPIVDVVLPSQCVRKENLHEEECDRMGQELWGTSTSSLRYPNRYMLDIESHKEFYDLLGVEQYFIIMVRDSSISHKARSRDHCQNPTLVRKEEEVGRDIIIDAINKYILQSDKTGKKKVTKENYDYWRASTFKGIHRRMAHGRKLRFNSVIPNGNNVVLVSYETLMMLKEPYIKMMFEALDIHSDYVPSIRDGNAKYVP